MRESSIERSRNQTGSFFARFCPSVAQWMLCQDRHLYRQFQLRVSSHQYKAEEMHIHLATQWYTSVSRGEAAHDVLFCACLLATATFQAACCRCCSAVHLSELHTSYICSPLQTAHLELVEAVRKKNSHVTQLIGSLSKQTSSHRNLRCHTLPISKTQAVRPSLLSTTSFVWVQ